VAKYTFISYTHQDSRFAKKLARYLRRQGIAVWLDQWSLADEAEWNKAIEWAIKRCCNFLIILSPAAVNSWVVREQFRLAVQAEKPVVSILRQPCVLPVELEQIPPIDLTGTTYRVALKQLLFQLSDQPASARVESKLFLTDVIVAWLQRLPSLLWPGWLGLSILFSLVAVISFLLWPDVDASTFVAAPLAERLPVVTPNSKRDLTPTPFASPIQIKVRARDGKVMVYVPSGEFLLGSTDIDPLTDEDEKPIHRVYLDAYWIDKMEISNIQYQLCVDAGACTPHRSQGQRFESDHQPVVGVDWFQSVAYCEWVGGRLPTEAEWEKAARGIDGRVYPWGDEFEGTRLNFCDSNCIADWRDFEVDDGYAYTAPVGSYPSGASPYGALDMSGNVWEWTADWYAADYYRRSPYENPTGPISGKQRVVRGGSWYYYGKNLRATTRHQDLPTYRYDNIGFRCAMAE